MERFTGLDLFPNLPDPIEEMVESNFDYYLWEKNGQDKASSVRGIDGNTCMGITKKGVKCKRKIKQGSYFCWQHK